MAWYVNDLSLCGQYSAATAFLDGLGELMRVRSQVPGLNQQLFCSKTLHTRAVTHNMDFRKAVQSAPDPTTVRLVLAWLTKYGPFWEDAREPNEDDYFEHDGEDVTDLGLGEAARRRIANRHASSFSFNDGGFDYTPIEVLHGLPEDPIGTVPVPNLWDTDTLRESALAATPAPTNWRQMLEQAQGRFDKLSLSPQSIDNLQREPFSQYVVERIFVLLSVLQEFVACRREDGRYSDRNHELIAQHFGGEKAWFSDESETNKQHFYQEMSFTDPEQPGEKIFCPWHGKIKTPQLRIHFEWPMEAQSRLRVFYIGPKITKG